MLCQLSAAEGRLIKHLCAPSVTCWFNAVPEASAVACTSVIHF